MRHALRAASLRVSATLDALRFVSYCVTTVPGMLLLWMSRALVSSDARTQHPMGLFILGDARSFSALTSENTVGCNVKF